MEHSALRILRRQLHGTAAGGRRDHNTLRAPGAQTFPSFRSTLATFSSIVCARSVRVPRRIVV